MPRSKLYRPFNDTTPGLGLITLEFYTNSNTFESFYVYNVSPGKLAQLALRLTANAGGNEFAFFTRDGFFFNKGAGVTLRNGFAAITTDKTTPGFDFRALTVGNLVLLQAKAPTNIPTHWEMVLQSTDLAP